MLLEGGAAGTLLSDGRTSPDHLHDTSYMQGRPVPNASRIQSPFALHRTASPSRPTVQPPIGSGTSFGMTSFLPNFPPSRSLPAGLQTVGLGIQEENPGFLHDAAASRASSPGAGGATPQPVQLPALHASDNGAP